MSDQRILIIEDDPLVAASIKVALKKLDFLVADIAYSYTEANDKLLTTEPDIAFVDINLNGRFDGLKLAEQIHSKGRFPYIFLTAYADRKILEEAKKYEPAGYIVKPFDEHDLLANIEIALYNFAQKQKHVNPKVDWKKVNDILMDKLSDREIEVMDLVFEGKTNQQIAKDLFLSLATIKSHLSRIYSKLDVNSRTAAMAKLRGMMK